MKHIPTYFFYSIFLGLILVPYSSSANFSVKNWFSNIESKLSKRKTKNEITKINVIEKPEITITNIKGNITISTWRQSKVLIETTKNANEADLTNLIVSTNIDAKKSHIHIISKSENEKQKGEIDFNIIIPENSSLITAKTEKGTINIKEVNGKIEAITGVGNINIQNSQKTIFAKTKKRGTIKVSLKELNKKDKCTLETNSGTIIISLPEDIQANINAKTEKGTIRSEQEITISPIKMKLNHKSFEEFVKNINGTIGSGGANITIASQNGSIKITN